jgi:hypothetical protein
MKFLTPEEPLSASYKQPAGLMWSGCEERQELGEKLVRKLLSAAGLISRSLPGQGERFYRRPNLTQRNGY